MRTAHHPGGRRSRTTRKPFFMMMLSVNIMLPALCNAGVINNNRPTMLSIIGLLPDLCNIIIRGNNEVNWRTRDARGVQSAEGAVDETLHCLVLDALHE